MNPARYYLGYVVRTTKTLGSFAGDLIMGNSASAPVATKALDVVLKVKGKQVTLREIAGPSAKAILVVNVASECGFTPQYKGLQKLYDELGPRGLVIVGTPCNQFGAQEPGSEAEIEQFTCDTFKVSFPLTAKLEVNGANAHELYRILKAARGGMLGTSELKWNFQKFLLDGEGRVVERYGSITTPEGLKADIEKLLQQQ